jgi:hypothetical protein
MPKLTIWLAAAAALAVPQAIFAKPAAPARAQPAPDRALAVGTVIDSNAETISGWRKLYGFDYTKRNQLEGKVEETEECCYAVFEKGMALLVVRTEAASRGTGSKPLTERIVRSKWITRRPDETVTDCQILWIAPQLSLFDNKTEAIRSVVIENGELVLISWRDPGTYCAHGD